MILNGLLRISSIVLAIVPSLLIAKFVHTDGTAYARASMSRALSSFKSPGLFQLTKQSRSRAPEGIDSKGNAIDIYIYIYIYIYVYTTL